MTRRRPLVALVGRPNVGKSTLFNRIVGERLAIVESIAGTTRDRLYAAAEWNGKSFDVVDTGGLELADTGEIGARIANQAQLAIDEADVVVMVTDALAGVSAADQEVAALLRKSQKPIVLAVNKSEKQANRLNAAEFWALGLGEPCPVSAVHGSGSGDLLDRVTEALPAQDAEEDDPRLRVAIVGRPNVGKSSLLNRLVGQDRMIVSAEAGTTRDAVDTTLRYHGEEIVLVDTAGIRRRGKVEPGIEKYAVLRAMRAIEACDVAVVLIDAFAGVTAQDTHVAGFIHEAGRGAIIALNKWDLIEKDTHTIEAYERQVRHALKFLDYAPILTISAHTGQRVTKVLDLAMQIHATRHTRIATSELNRLVEDIQARHSHSRGGRLMRVRYATQVAVAPPTFVFFVNDQSLLHFGYERYVENQIRERFGFEGTPLRLMFREQRREGQRAGRPHARR
ncbi:ribosome biogenesis GTPase Der [bacterium]|nr:ribosome biogenesis GTPase Der [Chloroflexi bacterium CFX6]RIL08989.1 MAG: ribosome biogenesis GTPase Der [bacterium]